MDIENKRLNIYDLVILPFLGALLFVVQIVFAGLPNVELVSFLIIIYTLYLGKKTFYSIYIFVILEIVYWGFNTWSISYLYIWSILALIVLILKRKNSIWLWSFVSAFFGLAFGALCALTILFIGGVSAAAAYWVSGIYFDIVHCVFNFALCLIFYTPVNHLFKVVFRKRRD